MEEWKARIENVILGKLDLSGDVQPPPIELSVWTHDALGDTSGSRSVENCGRVAQRHIYRLHWLRDVWQEINAYLQGACPVEIVEEQDLLQGSDVRESLKVFEAV